MHYNKWIKNRKAPLSNITVTEEEDFIKQQHENKIEVHIEGYAINEDTDVVRRSLSDKKSFTFIEVF